MRFIAVLIAGCCLAAPALAQSVASDHATYPFPANAQLHSDALNAAIASRLDASKVQTDNLVWSVCSTGCRFASPLDAWAAARAYVAFGPYSSITINVADGVYSLNAPMITEEPGTSSIHFVGNLANPSAVQFNYPNITGNNGSAVIALNGGRFGNSNTPGMNGIAVTGYGAQVDRQTWKDQSYGAAFLSLGSGANIHIGGAMIVSHFYYSVLADEGGRFVGDPGGQYAFAGDVNLLARHGGVIHCLTCHMTTAAHILPNNGGEFGFNIMAEAGGAVYADGSTGTDAQVACFAAQTSASMWAHDVTGSNCGAAGGRVVQGAFAEFTRAKFYNSGVGIIVYSNGNASVDGAELYSNKFEGLHAIGGQAYGNNLYSHDNGAWGVKGEKGSRIELYNSLATITGNTAGPVFNETGVPCTVLNGACLPPSLAIIY